MTSDRGESSHFVDSHLLDISNSPMKKIVKLDAPATIIVTGHSTLRGVSMRTPTVRVTNAQGFIYDMLVLAMNASDLSRHLFSVGTAAHKRMNTVIANISYLDVVYSKILFCRDTDCPIIDYLGLELAPRGNPETQQHFRRGSSRSNMAFYNDIYGDAKCRGATDNIFNVRRTPDQWCHHRSGFSFHSSYVFCGAHDYTGVLPLP